MRYPCQPVGPEIFDAAPMLFRNSSEIAATPTKIFSIFEDGESWPRWFKGIRKVQWTSPRPFGVGTTRVVTLDMLTVDEHFFRWEPGRRFSFHLTAHSVPLAEVLAEDYLLEEIAPGRTRFTYTVAVRPRLLLKLGGPLARGNFNRMFQGACQGLAAYAPNA
ncbi:MAG: SRPBCC family protein [Myxococcota bacterium]